MIRKTSDRLCRRGCNGDMFIATYESDYEIGSSDAGDLMREMYSSDDTVWASYDLRGKKMYVSYPRINPWASGYNCQIKVILHNLDMFYNIS